jgi:hypothetical protein
MIVFDLKCGNDHVFEAWFGSSAAFADQQQRGLVRCPLCDNPDVEKAPMAARVSAKGNQSSARSEVSVARPEESFSPEGVKAFLAKVADAQKKMLAKSTWVGRDFDTKARAMDAGDIDPVAIHGEVSTRQAEALIEDGIAVLPLPMPIIPPEKQN